MNKQDQHLLSECSSDEDALVMPLQISKNSKALNSLLDQLGLPFIKISEEDASNILKLIEIKN